MEHFIPTPGERPDVEVLVDRTWHPGELCMWTPLEGGGWSAQVQWRDRPRNTRIGAFDADRVRPVDEPSARPLVPS